MEGLANYDGNRVDGKNNISDLLYFVVMTYIMPSAGWFPAKHSKAKN